MRPHEEIIKEDTGVVQPRTSDVAALLTASRAQDDRVALCSKVYVHPLDVLVNCVELHASIESCPVLWTASNILSAMLDVSDGSINVKHYDLGHDLLLDHTLAQLDLLSTGYFVTLVHRS
jgi:hypothetical protein